MTATMAASDVHVPVRVASVAISLLGGLSAVVVLWTALDLGLLPVLGAAVLPTAWLAAGAVAVVRRPGQVGGLLLTCVGALHLSAFAVAASLGPSTDGWTGWLAGLASTVLFAGGFAALAVLLASYPADVLRTRRFARGVLVVAVATPVVEALTRGRVPLAVEGRVASVPAPEPLPVLELPFSVAPLVPLLVVAGAGLLVARARRMPASDRRTLSGATAAGGLLALLLLATPAASVLLSDGVWASIFVVGGSLIPFVLLAGILGYRPTDVERYADQMLAHGAVLVVAASVYAGAVAAGVDPAVAGVVVLAGAVVATGTLAGRLTHLVDRSLTGGRVHGTTVMRQFVESLESAGTAQVARRTADAVVDALAASWARVVVDGDAAFAAGQEPADRDEPAVVVPLMGSGETVGRLEAGPRRGGWADTDRAQLTVLARHAALAIHSGRLTEQLADQVDELRRSRARLVLADQEARRRLERDLHDGVQQQLVALLSRLGALEVVIDPASPGAEFVSLAKDQAEASLSELRELVRGIHPPLLADRGLAVAIRSRAALLPVPTEVVAGPDVSATAVPPETQTTAYYVVSEALTNVVKHADAHSARVTLAVDGGNLRVEVRDDGSTPAAVDGRSTTSGTGLRGMRDRVEALGGRVTVSAAPGRGTAVVALLPLGEPS